MRKKRIEGFPNYEIWEDGTIFSFYKMRKLKPFRLHLYWGVGLHRKKKKASTYIHRLLAQHFIPNPNNLPEVNHLDGEKLNNRLENLEWVSHLKNMEHAATHGLMASEFKLPHTKLANWEVSCIKRLTIDSDLSGQELAQLFKISRPTISEIKHGVKRCKIKPMAPFKSIAQKKKFAQLLKEGKISQKLFDEFNKDTPRQLPNRLHAKKLKQMAKMKRVKNVN